MICTMREWRGKRIQISPELVKADGIRTELSRRHVFDDGLKNLHWRPFYFKHGWT